MSALDVPFSPAGLVAASRQVLDSPTSPAERATTRTLEAFLRWALERVAEREVELRAVVRRELREDATPDVCRRAVEAVALEDRAAVEQAVRRLERRLDVGYGELDEAAVHAALGEERRVVEDLGAGAPVRVVRAAEAELAWTDVMRPA